MTVRLAKRTTDRTTELTESRAILADMAQVLP